MFGAMFGGYFFLAKLMWQRGRRRLILFCNVAFQALMSLLGFVGIVVFMKGTESFREQIKSENVFGVRVCT